MATNDESTPVTPNQILDAIKECNNRIDNLRNEVRSLTSAFTETIKGVDTLVEEAKRGEEEVPKHGAVVQTILDVPVATKSVIKAGARKSANGLKTAWNWIGTRREKIHERAQEERQAKACLKQKKQEAKATC